MNLHYFVSFVLLIALTNLVNVNTSWLSRFKNFNNYPQQEELDLDVPMGLKELKRYHPQLFEDLMEEKPELRMMMEMRRKNKSQEVFYFPPPPLPPPGVEDNYDEEDEDLALAIKMQRKLEQKTKNWWMKNNSKWNNIAPHFLAQNVTRRFHPPHFSQLGPLKEYYTKLMMYKGMPVAKCYECGNIKGIPRSKLCHDAFDSQDGKARTIGRYFKTHCHSAPWNYHHWKRKEYGLPWILSEKFLGFPNPIEPLDFATPRPILPHGPMSDYRYFLDRGNPMHDYYRGYTTPFCCVKRFLDIGGIYTQRGCKSWPPMFQQRIEYGLFSKRTTSNFANHRYKKLEATLGEFPKEGCIYSPAASLTPFARGISLFARYHVCVCYGDYCNDAYARVPNPSLMFLIFLIVFFNIVNI